MLTTVEFISVIYGTKKIRFGLNCEKAPSACRECPFRKMKKNCPGRALQDFIDQERKRINED